MFSRFMIVRLKAAEHAMKQGRLDEAFRVAAGSDVREHKRAGALLTALCEKFIARSREHFGEERFSEALTDLQKAEAAGVRLDEIAELREQIRVVAEEVQRKRSEERTQFDAAAQRVHRGSLAAGRRMLDDLDAHDPRARKLEADIEQRKGEADAGFSQAKTLMENGDLSGAVDRLRAARKLDPHAAEASALESAICDVVVRGAFEAFESGRINRALEDMKMLGDLGRHSSARRDLDDLLEMAQAASVAMDRKDYDSARRHAMRLQALSPKIGWVKESVKRLEQLDDVVTQLHAGPFGEHAKSFHCVAANPKQAVAMDETVALARRADRDVQPHGLQPHGLQGHDVQRPGSSLPNHLLLLVDGGGSYLLLRQDRMSIGRSMTANPADVPIQSSLAERHAEIIRVEDDYFLMASQAVDVDGRRVTQQLLRDGARVGMARNARFTFRTPHPQSPSAVLEMGGPTRMPLDVRRVVLFRETATIGFGRHVHIPCSQAVHNLVLFERSGRFWVRPQRNGRIDSEALPVEIGKQMEMLNVSFCLQPWKPADLAKTFT